MKEIVLPLRLNEAIQSCHDDPCVTPVFAKYIGHSVEFGRSLNSAVIVLVGDSGSGKSSTINTLFADNLCPVNPFRSQTKGISVIQKRLRVPLEDEGHSVVGNLVVVDTPGTFDTDDDDARNVAIIKRFRHEFPPLASSTREVDLEALKGLDLPNFSFQMRTPVYPNVVLLILKAGDRVGGKSARIRRTLKILKETSMVDSKFSNLIVVVTNSLWLASQQESYKVLKLKMEEILRETVKDILSLENVPVVFVENQGCPQGLPLDEESGYHVLPDGELSHFNLLEAIQKTLGRKSGPDILGILLLGWYTNSTCPEREQKASVDNLEITPDGGTLAQVELELEQIRLLETQGACRPSKFQFRYLGHGFCPVRGETLVTNLLGGEDDMNGWKVVKIGGKSYLLPKSVNVSHDKSTALSVVKHEETLTTSSSSSGAGSFSCKLIFDHFDELSAGGDWTKLGHHDKEESVVCFSYERRIALCSIDDTRTLSKCPTFRKPFQSWTSLEEVTVENSSGFFERWGTHVVTQQHLGGAIYMLCKLKKENLIQDKMANLESTFGKIFSKLGVPGGGIEYRSIVDEMRSNGVINERVLIIGGDSQPNILKLEDLTPQLLVRWEEGLLREPANLARCTSFLPFYLLIEDDQKGLMADKVKEFRTVTNEYIDSQGKGRGFPKWRTRDEQADFMRDTARKEYKQKRCGFL